jgi:hypothetical protein
VSAKGGFCCSMTVAGLALAFPRVAHAYVDPGAGTMLWQMGAATVIGSLFYIKRIATWTRRYLGVRSRSAPWQPPR